MYLNRCSLTLNYSVCIRNQKLQRVVNMGKILDQSNLKDFADDKIKVTFVPNFVLGSIESIVGKGVNAGYQHFCFSHSVSKELFVRVFKSQDCVVKG